MDTTGIILLIGLIIAGALCLYLLIRGSKP
jgi:hypothetical protein